MPPIVKVLLGFTMFELMIVELTGESGSCLCWDPCLCWERLVYARSFFMWKEMREELTSALGKPVYAPSPQYLEFTPREYVIFLKFTSCKEVPGKETVPIEET